MSLFEELSSEGVLFAAWDKVADNDGAAGIDGIELEDFELRLSKNIRELHLRLLDHTYVPSPLRRTYLAKSDGSRRPLAIPTVADRIVQTACAAVLTPLIDPTFEPSSHAYRSERGVHTATVQIELLRDQGYRWVVDADIDDFFDEVDHETLLAKVRLLVPDTRVVSLIESWLKVPVREGYQDTDSVKGLPQGSPVAPLLANLYLDAFDDALGKRGLKIVRYADDFLVLCRNQSDAEGALEVVESLLDDLKLTLHERKTRIGSFDEGFSYLGGRFQNNTVTFPPRDLAPEPEITSLAEGFSLPEVLPDVGYMPRYPLLRCLYVEAQGATLRKDQGRFLIRKGESTLLEVPIIKVEHIVVFGTAHVTTPAMKHCLASNIPITFLSERGEYYGRLENPMFGQVTLQAHQFARTTDDRFRLKAARSFVQAKISNSRTLLQRAKRNRNKNIDRVLEEAIASLAEDLQVLPGRTSVPELMALEGHAARTYFTAFARLVGGNFSFGGRTKRPPRDPVNSLLSFGYTLLFYNIYSLLRINGLNPYLGHLHAVRDRTPSLASDLIEEFRSPIVDSLVLTLLSKGVIKQGEFLPAQADEPCLLTSAARRRFIEHFEKRLRTPVVHPPTGYNVDWRRCIQLQIQSYKRLLQDDAYEYEGMTLR